MLPLSYQSLLSNLHHSLTTPQSISDGVKEDKDTAYSEFFFELANMESIRYDVNIVDDKAGSPSSTLVIRCKRSASKGREGSEQTTDSSDLSPFHSDNTSFSRLATLTLNPTVFVLITDKTRTSTIPLGGLCGR